MSNHREGDLKLLLALISSPLAEWLSEHELVSFVGLCERMVADRALVLTDSERGWAKGVKMRAQAESQPAVQGPRRGVA